jgi:hypothetical protein
VHLQECGGLNVGAGIYDCLTYCRCTDPATCDNVCPNNIEHMVARSMEVQGFDLATVADAPTLRGPVLPRIVPMLYHSAARARAPAASVVALSLYEVMGKQDGVTPFTSRQALLEHFKLGDNTTIILTGTHNDRPLERWWKLADPKKVTRTIRELGVELITTPNFSLFDDVPRHDNLYNMKRIARVWSEIQNEGVLCALHLNARTDRDWECWISFLKAHPEVASVAFEFGTGAGSKSRVAWYLVQLCRLADQVGRPLQLITRGGVPEIGTLAAAFSATTVIDTSAFIRAQKRWRIAVHDGKLSWTSSPTAPGSPIDDLFDANVAALEDYAAYSVRSANRSSGAVSAKPAAA